MIFSVHCLNHRGAPAHCLKCIRKQIGHNCQPLIDSYFQKKDIPKERHFTVPATNVNLLTDNFDNATKMLIQLICDKNIPYTQLSSNSWHSFIHSLNPSFIIPSIDKL